MRQVQQYVQNPIKYYSKLWNLPLRAMKDFLSLYEMNNQIWKYKRYKDWFKKTYAFNLTPKRWREFRTYYKVHKRRVSLRLPNKTKITSEFITEALSNTEKNFYISW